jgi:hypothetical protein
MFSVSWMGPPMSTASEPQMAAAVMALNIFAGESGPYPGTGLLENHHEAENATIRGVGLEAASGDFTGWGYVTGWRRDGQRSCALSSLPLLLCYLRLKKEFRPCTRTSNVRIT